MTAQPAQPDRADPDLGRRLGEIITDGLATGDASPAFVGRLAGPLREMVARSAALHRDLVAEVQRLRARVATLEQVIVFQQIRREEVCTPGAARQAIARDN